MVVLLLSFIPLEEGEKQMEHVSHLWECGGVVKRTSFPTMKMVMYGHKYCHNDQVVDMCVNLIINS